MGFYGFVVTANEMEYVEKRTVAVWGLNKEVDEDLIKELFIQVCKWNDKWPKGSF